MWFLENYMIYVLLALLLGVIIAIIFIPKKSFTTQEIAVCASCIAMSFALSYAKFSLVGKGGSITLASIIPLAVYAYFAGVKKGLMAAFIYSILQMFQSFYFQSVIQLLLDYILPFTIFGVVAALKPLRKRMKGYDFVIMLTAAFVFRYLCHFLIGIIPLPQGWGALPFPEGLSANIVYSLWYNSTYVPLDFVIAFIVAVVFIQSRALSRIEKLYLHNDAHTVPAEKGEGGE